MTKIAYLVSDYFAPSHTFVRREVAALRKMDVHIVPFSIQASGKGEVADAQSVLHRSPFDYIFAPLSALFARPWRFLSSWRLSLSHRPPGLRGLLWSQFHFIEAIVLVGLLKGQGCTRLHNHFANSAATVGMIAAHFLNMPWSMTLHGISETDFPAGMLLGKKLERADFVACASYFMQAQAMRLVSSGHWSKMHIVRCGIDPSKLPPPNPVNASADCDATVKLICVGRLSAEKGYIGLLDCLARISDIADSFALTVVGDGPMASEIRQKSDNLSLSDRVRFVGALSERDTLAHIRQADILVLPSLMEGLPVVLIEAMAMGKAVVAARVAGIPELIEDGQTGLMFTPSDWKDLQRQIERILKDKDFRHSLGTNASAKVSQEFTSEHAALQMAVLLKDSEPQPSQ